MTDLSQISALPMSSMTDKEHEKYDRYTKKFHIPQYDIPQGHLDEFVQFSGNPERVSVLDPVAY